MVLTWTKLNFLSKLISIVCNWKPGTSDWKPSNLSSNCWAWVIEYGSIKLNSFINRAWIFRSSV